MTKVHKCKYSGISDSHLTLASG